MNQESKRLEPAFRKTIFNSLKGNLSITSSFVCLVILFSIQSTKAQQVYPYQTGAYLPAFANVRDMSQSPPGLFVLWYNYYGYTDRYFDKDGNETNTIPNGFIDPSIPAIDLDINVKSFVTVPALYWAAEKKILGGARYMVGITPSYMWVDIKTTMTIDLGVSDTTVIDNSELNGFGDLAFSPGGLFWGFKHLDISLIYGLTAPTGRYEAGADDNIGLGFWTNQVQGFGYYYPVEDKSTALMLGLTYEFTGKVKGEDFNPGNRFTLEWGFSQYLSDKLELAMQGGHNFQVTDDEGSDVFWDASNHDKKSTVGFMVNYWLTEQFGLNAKYNFDFGSHQRFKANAFMLNLVYIPNILDENK